jgi:oligopeptidase B
MTPPIAKKISYSYEIHGLKIEDEYFWLRDKKWPKVEDKEIISYLEEENKYTDSFFDQFKKEKEILFEEMKSRIKLTDQSLYVKKDDYYYYVRTEESLDYPIYCRKYGNIEADEEILLDVNELAKGQKYTQLGGFSISPDHQLLAYSIDHKGDERFEIKILNLETREYLSDKIADIIGEIVWHEKINGFFYIPTNEKWRHDKIMFHKLSDDSKNDKLIYHEKDQTFNVGISKSSSKKFIFLGVSGHDSNEVHYIKMDDESFTSILIEPRKDKIEYDVDHGEDGFYIHVNDISRNFRLVKAAPENPGSKFWKPFIDANNDYLNSVDITRDYLILNYKQNGLSLIKIIRLKDNKTQIIKFPDNSYSAGSSSTNYIENDIRVGYSSLKRPSTTYQYDFDKDSLAILKEQIIPSGFNPDEYEVERIWAENDGVKVPISLLYKKSLFKKDGTSPLYLHGYGSYGIGMSAGFRTNIFSLVNRGVSFAIAHVRGGDDLGFDWYESAKFLNKKKTFDDFAACTNYLIDQSYTNKGNIIIMGGSAGGLLVGNAINDNPDLYKAAIAHVPFVDLISTMLDETLPLTPGEYKEWGNPKEKEYFDYMKSYSPYDNVKKQNYPTLFVTAGLSDPRVGYFEGAKWVARLRENNTGPNKIYLKTNMDFGHSGASGRFDYLKEVADDYIFILYNFGKI